MEEQEHQPAFPHELLLPPDKAVGGRTISFSERVTLALCITKEKKPQRRISASYPSPTIHGFGNPCCLKP